MKKQYLLQVQFPDGVKSGTWWIGAKLDPKAKPGQRFYDSEKEAKAALNRLLEKFNKVYVYDENGKRRETQKIGGGFAADIILDKKLDDASRIVAWKIKVREVTEWEEVTA